MLKVMAMKTKQRNKTDNAVLDMSPFAMLLQLLLLFVSPHQSAEILGLFQSPGRSQWGPPETMLRALESRGHRITVVTTYRSSNTTSSATWNEILIPRFLEEPGGVNTLQQVNNGIIGVMKKYLSFSQSMCHAFLRDENVQRLHKSGKRFDVIILETLFAECVLGYAHHFDSPVVVFTSFAATNWIDDMVGNPSPYAYVPHSYVPYTTRMSFSERLINTLVGVVANLFRQFVYLPKLDAILQMYLRDPALPKLSKIEKEASLLLINYHFSYGCPRPLLPNAIEVGGLHVRPPKKLPPDIQKFLDEAKDGAIYFSMGSNVRSTDWPEEKRLAFMKVFSGLKQRILWKWEAESLPGQPPNVMIAKWLPQADILAHKNIRAFITHGGLLSIQEATDRGVPLVGLPVYGDQPLNMATAEKGGYAVKIHVNNVTESSIRWALDQVLNVPRYREKIRELARIFNDRPRTALDEAVYWMEYVIRHQGAPHLRTAVLDLHWYQLYLLDVIGLFLATCVLVLVVLTLIFKVIFRLLCGVRTEDKGETESAKQKKYD